MGPKATQEFFATTNLQRRELSKVVPFQPRHHEASTGKEAGLRTLILERGPEVRRWILAGAIVVIPLVVVRTLNNGVNTPKFALIIVVLSLVAAIRIAEISQGAPAGTLKLALIPAGAFVVPLLISWLLSDFKGWTWLGEYGRWQGLFPYLLFALWGIFIADAFEGHLSKLVWAFAVVGGAVGLLATLQALGLDPIPGYTRSAVPGSIATLGNPNFTGGFLAILLPASLGLWFAEPERRLLLSAILIVTAVGVVVTLSQGGWVAALVGVSIILGSIFGPTWTKARTLSVVIAVGAVLFAVALAAAPLVFDSLKEYSPQSVRLRGMWWAAAVDMGADSPVWGNGPNAFGYEGVQHRLQEEAELDPFGFPDDPHSVLFAMFANAGILGAGGFLLSAAWALKKARTMDQDDILKFAIAASVAAYFAQSLLSIDELSLRLVFWSAIGGLAVSASTSAVKKKRSTKQKTKTARSRSASPQRLQNPIVLGAALLVPIAAFWYTSRFVAADRAIALAFGELRRDEISEAAEEFERALSLRDDYEYRHIYGFRIGPVGGRDSRYFEAMERAMSFVPEFPDLPAIRDKARLYAAGAEREITGFLDKAADLYEVALDIDPYNRILREEGLEVLLMAERDSYVVDYVHGLPEDSKEQYAWAALALAAGREGETELALDALDIAVALNFQLDWVIQAQEVLGVEPETP